MICCKFANNSKISHTEHKNTDRFIEQWVLHTLTHYVPVQLYIGDLPQHSKRNQRSSKVIQRFIICFYIMLSYIYL